VRPFLLLLRFLVVLGDRSPWWSFQTSGLDTNLRGVSVKYDQGSRVKQHYFVWAAGSNGSDSAFCPVLALRGLWSQARFP